ncbi:MAG: hypothetical protein PUF72_09965 [Clostridiales bacterium]|nr:hypothetical protein [Clostridiales bacterium]
MAVLIAVYNYIGALIGAGFASGQEILTFFVRYGKWGGAGVAVASAIFGLFAYYITDLARKNDCYDYGELIKKLTSARMAAALKWVTALFSLGVYVVMMSCFGELAKELFGWRSSVGAAVMTAIAALLLLCRESRVLRINGALGLVTAAGIIGATFYMLATREQQTFLNGARAVMESGAYAGYNVLGAGVLLCRLAKDMRGKFDAALVGAASGLLMFVMMSGAFLLLSMYNNRIPLGSLPMLTMAMRSGRAVTVIYSLMLISALVTTAVAGGISVMDIASRHIGRKYCLFLMSALALIVSNAGFARLIGSVYRTMGYVGMILIAIFIILSVIKRNTAKNEEIKSI